MSNDWGFDWDAEATRRADDPPESATLAASLPSRAGRHRRSNSTPLENTSSQLLTAASDSKAEEQEDNADDINGNFVRDVLNGPTLTKTRSERVKSRGGGRGTRRGALQSAARQNAALAQRVSGRMTKGRSKLSVLPEGYSTDEEEDSGEDGYQHVLGKGGKVRRVLANRQSAQRSRIRKLQHISELEVTLEALQDDLFKLNPQLSKLEAKQAGKASVQTCWKKLYLQSVRQITIQRALNSLGDTGPLPALPVTSTSTPYDAQTFICTCDGSRERLTKRKTLSKSDDTLNPKL